MDMAAAPIPPRPQPPERDLPFWKFIATGRENSLLILPAPGTPRQARFP